MDEEDNVSLTSFRPLSPENSKSNFSLAKFFQRKRPQARVEIKVNAPKSCPPGAAGNQRTVSHHQHGSRSSEIHKSFSSPMLTRKSSGPQVVGVDGRYATPGYRNLSAVLGRLSIAADKRGQLRQEYKESNFKQYWMPDENCKECYECGEKFNTFRRRHHCRLCGQIFCYRCCYMEIPGKLMGYTGFLRVCTYCHKVVKVYTQAPDLSVARNMEQTAADYRVTSPDLETSSPSGSSNLTVQKTYPFDFDEDENIYPQSSLRKVSGGSAVISSGPYEFDQLDWTSPLQGRRPFDAFGVCAAEADMLKQDSFRELWHQIISPRSGLELQSHRFRLKTYQNCLVGSELVDWLLTYEKASTRNQAVTIGQKLLDYCWLEPVPNTKDGVAVFKDEYVLYQPGTVAMRETSANKRSSTFWSDVDKAGDKNTVESDEGNAKKNDDDDDNDEMVPHWFKQLEQQGVEPATEEKDSSYSQENAGKVKVTGPKLLDLDLMNGVASEEDNSELSLKVDLQHFGEPGRIGLMSADPNQESHGSKLSLITDAPPPPLEQYVYTEGYPHTPLRPSTKKSYEGGVVLSTSNSADEIFSGAMIAKKIGVDRPCTPELSELREDNGERLAMERLRAAHKYYLTTLLDQLLKDASLSVDWKDIILPLVKQVSEQVTPDVRKDDDMDICHYVKFKKIPGGNKSDCEIISGVVFTKNIANKKMANVLINPKILVLSCAIDYQRNENRLASLDPLVLQEYEFLKNFVARVVSLRPNVLVVEKTVSRLAQDMLLQHGITVVLNVKPEVIERIARCTRADVLRSMEQVSRPQLGSCHSFNVQRYLLKNGESKTLIFIDGCPTDLGCTVKLRGGNSFVLAKVKRIFQHMVYVAYSLRIELHFLMDEFAMPPDPKALFEERSECGDYQQKAMNSTEISTEGSPDSHETTTVNFTEIFSSAMKRTMLSSSPFLEYPLPYLLTDAGINCAIRSALPRKIYWSACIDAECKAHPLTEQDLEEFDFANPRQRRINKAVCVLEPHPFIAASLTMDHSDRLFQGLLSDFRAQGGQIHLTRNGAVITRSRSKWFDGVGKKMSSKPEKTEDKAAQGDRKTDQIAAELLNGEMSQQNLAATSSSTHFNRKVDCLDPFNHQRIAVLFSSYSSESNNSPRPCISPWAVFMEFYRRNDITLGGFLEIYCFRPSYICPNPNCDVPMVDHVRYFAHGTGSVYIHMRNLESPIPGFQHTILTWSWCKECKQVTPIVPLSPEAWALSFAKYLELRFYAGSYQRRASVEPCGHSLHRDHYQYFAYANMVASFKYRSIKLFETVIPPPLINIKEKTRDASFWLSDLKAMAARGDTVFSDFNDRLDSLKANPSQLDREAKIQQFAIELSEEHDLFCEQVRIVEKKAESLRSPENPLVMEDEHSCHQLSPDDRQALEYVIADSLNSLKKILCKAVDSWNTRLQEFVQAEKKKNLKSPKEGKYPSSGQTDAVKSGDTQGLKSSDLLGLPGDDLASLDVSPSPAFSPSQTPRGSRTTSPYPSLVKNEETPEALTPGDMEVFRANCMFRPISLTEKSPPESPSDGIIPVGGVVKGHPIPQAEEPSKSVPLPRVTLERSPAEASATPACSFKGFVLVTPTREGSQGGMVNSENRYCLVVDGAKSNPALEASVSDENKARKDLSEDATVEAMGPPKYTKELSVGSMKEGTGVNMEERMEPPGVNIEKREELSGGNTEEAKVSTERPMEQGLPEGNMQALKQCVLSSEDTTVPTEKSIDAINGLGEHSTGNMEGHRVLCRDSDKRENCLLIDDAGETVRFTGEGLPPFNTENIANTNEKPTTTMEESLAAKNGNSKWNKGKVHITEEMAENDPNMFTVGQEKGGVTEKIAHRKIPFTRGHRRVASAPPNISILSTDGKYWEEREVDVTVSAIGRCRSDSDLSVHFRQNLVVSMSSIDATLDQLNVEEDLSQEDGETSKPGTEETSDNSGAVDGGRILLGFRKVSTIPKALQRRALANESGESDVSVISDGTTGISRREKVKHIISSFMPGSGFQPVASTFPNHEHHLLPPGEKVLVVVSEKETSSIIAYTLSTKEYNERLHEIQRTLCDIKNGTASEHHLLNKSEVSISVELSVKGRSISELPLAAETIVRINSDNSQDDYVHLDLANSTEAVDRIESEAAEIEITSGGKLEFLQKSGEVQKELETLGSQLPNHSRSDKSKYPKVKYSKIKQTGVKDEAGSNQDIQVQDDPSLVEFGFQRKNVNPPVDFHVKHQFADSSARFYCSIYYAEQFRNLRKRIFLDGEEKYIRSLQHSVAWGARGGKSGSAFFKSLDDRFVMKQMSRLELQSFLEFAPHYFRYINKALDDQRPTLLAKILGIYRIGFKNSQTSATMRQDVLVMENLFYDRKVDKTFDLKGSMRGRYVQSSEQNEVLMDENLLEMIREHPIFFRPHSKTVLSRAIHNDTEFLAQQMVMDYSLLVGIDEAQSELVIGIIDFIRTFTWDKKLEMYVKSSGILGGQGRMPTVVSPELYRTRFTEAMHRYFLMVPDKWTGLGNDLD